MNIKNPETERLAREAAELSGDSLTGVITTALREYLDRQKAAHAEDRFTWLMELSARSAALWKGSGVTSANATDFLYDDDGMPA